MRSKKFYVAAPFCDLAGRPHAGHARAAVAADALARHRRARDLPAHLQTCTAEHGPGIEALARGKGLAPGAWCGAAAAEYGALWKTLDVKHDQFLRASGPAHAAAVQGAFEKLLESGGIYKGRGAGLYCRACETFYREADLRGSNCPAHGAPAERFGGELYFFRLSKYSETLLGHYRKHPGFLSPRGPALELERLAGAGLRDVPVSRPAGAWGVPVKSDPGHAVCSWLDALLGCAAGAGYAAEGPSPDFPGLWPPDVQLTDGDGFFLHGAAWPAVLLALGLEPPRKVYAGGWLTVNGERMRRPGGNFIKAEDVAREYGADALRYFLLRGGPFGSDLEFSPEALKRLYDEDLAGGLGPLFAEVTRLAAYMEHRLPRKPEGSAVFSELSALTPEIDRAAEELRFDEALGLVWRAIGRLNRLLDEKKPWALAKKDLLAFKNLMHELVWCLRLVAGWLDPFMPGAASKMHLQLGVGFTASGVEPQKAPPLFPRKRDDRPGNPGLN